MYESPFMTITTHYYSSHYYRLVNQQKLLNMTIEIVDWLIKNGDDPACKVLVHREYIHEYPSFIPS